MKQKRKLALVTGASSGIGQAICGCLCGMGYEVYGIGRHFPGMAEQNGQPDGCAGAARSPESGISAAPEETAVQGSGAADRDGGFHPIVCDLRDTTRFPEMLAALRREWKQQGYALSVLVNNAGTAYYGLHEQLASEEISEMVRVNLEVPLLLTQQLLPLLRENRGAVIQIASVTAIASSPHGAAYAATKAGLLSFGRSLFDEVRKHGVRVTTILPDMTDTQLYRHADFGTDPAMDAHLAPQDVADAVAFSLRAREGTCVPEILLRPQLHRIRRK